MARFQRNTGGQIKKVKLGERQRAQDENSISRHIPTVHKGGGGVNTRRMGQAVIVAAPSPVAIPRTKGSGFNWITTTGETLSTGSGVWGDFGVTNYNSTSLPEVAWVKLHGTTGNQRWLPFTHTGKATT